MPNAVTCTSAEDLNAVLTVLATAPAKHCTPVIGSLCAQWSFPAVLSLCMKRVHLGSMCESSALSQVLEELCRAEPHSALIKATISCKSCDEASWTALEAAVHECMSTAQNVSVMPGILCFPLQSALANIRSAVPGSATCALPDIPSSIPDVQLIPTARACAAALASAPSPYSSVATRGAHLLTTYTLPMTTATPHEGKVYSKREMVQAIVRWCAQQPAADDLPTATQRAAQSICSAWEQHVVSLCSDVPPALAAPAAAHDTSTASMVAAADELAAESARAAHGGWYAPRGAGYRVSLAPTVRSFVLMAGIGLRAGDIVACRTALRSVARFAPRMLAVLQACPAAAAAAAAATTTVHHDPIHDVMLGDADLRALPCVFQASWLQQAADAGVLACSTVDTLLAPPKNSAVHHFLQAAGAAGRGDQKGSKHGGTLVSRAGTCVAVGHNHCYTRAGDVASGAATLAVAAGKPGQKRGRPRQHVMHAEVHCLCQAHAAAAASWATARDGVIWIVELDDIGVGFLPAQPCPQCNQAMMRAGCAAAVFSSDAGLGAQRIADQCDAVEAATLEHALAAAEAQRAAVLAKPVGVPPVAGSPDS